MEGKQSLGFRSHILICRCYRIDADAGPHLCCTSCGCLLGVSAAQIASLYSVPMSAWRLILRMVKLLDGNATQANTLAVCQCCGRHLLQSLEYANASCIWLKLDLSLSMKEHWNQQKQSWKSGVMHNYCIAHLVQVAKGEFLFHSIENVCHIYVNLTSFFNIIPRNKTFWDISKKHLNSFMLSF